jgi:hypothetical protein
MAAFAGIWTEFKGDRTGLWFPDHVTERCGQTEPRRQLTQIRHKPSQRKPVRAGLGRDGDRQPETRRNNRLKSADGSSHGGAGHSGLTAPFRGRPPGRQCPAPSQSKASGVPMKQTMFRLFRFVPDKRNTKTHVPLALLTCSACFSLKR